MSYRDLVNLTEALRALGFPERVSMESFRSPNFPLAERALRWLARRLEPGAELPGGGGSAPDRVALVTSSVEFFLSRANVRLNGRRLYGADGLCARELLKVAGVLRAALAAPGAAPPPDLSYDVSGKLSEIRRARQLAAEVTAGGAALHDLLARETEHKESRSLALSRALSPAGAARGARRACGAASAQLLATRERADAARAAAAAAGARLERRRAELDRAEKRLRTVQKIQPAYAGELRALQAALAALWPRYVTRYRCVEDLKHRLGRLEAQQAESAEQQQAAIMQLIHKYEAEDVLGALSDEEDAESASESPPPAAPARPAARPRTRLRVRTAAARSPDADALTYGGMTLRGSGDSGGSASDSADEVSPRDSARWPRPRPRPARPASRPARPPHAPRPPRPADLLESAAGSGASLGSSSDSELRLASAARASVLSDNEF